MSDDDAAPLLALLRSASNEIYTGLAFDEMTPRRQHKDIDLQKSAPGLVITEINRWSWSLSSLDVICEN
jgi:hypothetical protein